MQIWLLRHGTTEYNRNKCYQGRLDAPLSEEGRAELVQAPFAPQTVYVTPLMRTVQTAQCLFPTAQYTVIEDFREMDFGVFEGRSYRDMEHDAQYRAWVDGGCVDRCPEGESMAELSARTGAAFEMLVQEALERGETSLVIVAHGGTQMALMSRYVRPQKRFYEWMSPNAGGYVLELHAAVWQRERTMTYVRTVQFTKGGEA